MVIFALVGVVATAIVLFGFDSGAALATVLGVLVEVPVMSVVRIAVRTKPWYEQANWPVRTEDSQALADRS